MDFSEISGENVTFDNVKIQKERFKASISL